MAGTILCAYIGQAVRLNASSLSNSSGTGRSSNEGRSDEDASHRRRVVDYTPLSLDELGPEDTADSEGLVEDGFLSEFDSKSRM
jgi:hypothetical protein